MQETVFDLPPFFEEQPGGSAEQVGRNQSGGRTARNLVALVG